MLNCGFYLTAKNFGYPCPESSLNPIENLGIFEEKRHPQISKNAVLDEWQKIPLEYDVAHLIFFSMKRRLRTVIESKGGQFKINISTFEERKKN